MWLDDLIAEFRHKRQDYQIRNLEAEIDGLSDHIDYLIAKRSNLRMERMALEIEQEQRDNGHA